MIELSLGHEVCCRASSRLVSSGVNKLMHAFLAANTNAVCVICSYIMKGYHDIWPALLSC